MFRALPYSSSEDLHRNCVHATSGVLS